ncbi:MAG TPA: GTP-binding protein [Candidatus Doudnabacteria bacterium]|nr:GTP-binding protein [Candidatus Doudnabacteria bacterium]
MIPAIIIHGTLGSGKTTLLKHLLRLPEFSGAFIIENEFASVNVDQVTLAAHHDVEVYDIAGGCICCSSGTELIDALQSLVDRQWQKPVIIETTGVANSAQLIKQLLLSSVFIENFSFQKNIYVVDPMETTPSQLQETHLLDVALADIAVVGKVDIAPGEQVQQIEQMLHQLNDQLVVVHGTNGDYNFPESLLNETSRAEHAIINYMQDISNLDAAEHGMSYVLITDASPFPSQEKIQQVVNELQGHLDMEVKRIKGYVVDSSGGWWHVEATSNHSKVESAEPQDAPMIVIIGSNVNEQQIKSIIPTI